MGMVAQVPSGLSIEVASGADDNGLFIVAAALLGAEQSSRPIAPISAHTASAAKPRIPLAEVLALKD